MKIRATLAVLAIGALSLTACRTQASSGVSTDNPEFKIMVGGIEKVIYLPAKLTEQLGYFTEAGVKVQLLTEPAGATAENSLVSGDVHGVVGFYDHTIDLQAKGKCITSVVQFADVPGEAEVVATAKADAVKGPADFKGRKLGFTSPGSSTDFLTQYLATKAGVSTSDYTGVKAGSGQTFVAAVDNGAIDAGMTTDPTIATLVSTGKAKVLLDMRTVEGTKAALGGLYPASSLYMDCNFVQQHKEAVRKLAGAFVKTLAFINSHSAAEIAEKMPADFAGGNKDLYIKSINDSKGMFNSDGKMKADGAKNVLEVLSQFSPAVKPKKDQIDLSKTYTTEFVTNP
ncbi:ABC transporter substrate-binding protein [Lentzea nigeriaca]|jgi:NitT/TauT family transport system substrate-binding protein|uniref:ABC transporter substrate-binding protein n=1 Tax=Lentzea nigeriaca TaxID=1128665 RepID=UPI00195ABE54|nr:ABC transporter substrate-binding protein [Lentzea nigeriaca]MBM7864989.1 NitT/TauT family transport system substrate-binding protein [Lentzea nigeriaca]